MRNLITLMATIVVFAASTARATGPAGSDLDASALRASKLQAEMNKGKNYADAWAATSVVDEAAATLAAQHQAAMNAGKDHSDARPMPSADSSAVMANAERHQLAMNRGLDHEEARNASSSGR